MDYGVSPFKRERGQALWQEIGAAKGGSIENDLHAVVPHYPESQIVRRCLQWLPSKSITCMVALCFDGIIHQDTVLIFRDDVGVILIPISVASPSCAIINYLPEVGIRPTWRTPRSSHRLLTCDRQQRSVCGRAQIARDHLLCARNLRLLRPALGPKMCVKRNQRGEPPEP
ncbi:hypothetical protein HDF16_005137 [Granulicella aggregans]|uniref:Uncharacterized protein n=1 Tax=Granulicella aggregans TaxID=474949 RepID=A0A7W7ZJM9_9BACT|nr:hypothetical protein [Granulicella aggregans]